MKKETKPSVPSAKDDAVKADESPLERFKAFARAVFSVSKEDMLRAEAEEKAEKAKREEQRKREGK